MLLPATFMLSSALACVSTLDSNRPACLAACSIASPFELGETSTALELRTLVDRIELRSGGAGSLVNHLTAYVRRQVPVPDGSFAQAAMSTARSALLNGPIPGPQNPSMTAQVEAASKTHQAEHRRPAELDASMHLGAAVAGRLAVPSAFGAVVLGSAQTSKSPPRDTLDWASAGDFVAPSPGGASPGLASFQLDPAVATGGYLKEVASRPLTRTTVSRPFKAEEPVHEYLVRWSAVRPVALQAMESSCAHQASKRARWQLQDGTSLATASPLATLAMLQMLASGTAPTAKAQPAPLALRAPSAQAQPGPHPLSALARAAQHELPSKIALTAALSYDANCAGSEGAGDTHTGHLANGTLLHQPGLEPAQQPSSTSHLSTPQSCYWVVGAFGELGALVTEYLTMQHAQETATFVLLARTVSAGRRAASAATTSTVILFQADAACKGDAQFLAEQCPPQRLIHAGGVLRDAPLLSQSARSMRESAAPKQGAASALQALLGCAPIDHFTLFSSTSATLAPPGQAPYSWANAALGTLSGGFQHQGVPALALEWGAWALGMALRNASLLSRIERMGLGVLTPAKGLNLLHKVMHSGAASSPSLLLSPFDWVRLGQSQASQLTGDAMAAQLFADVVSSGATTVAVEPVRSAQGALTSIAVRPAEAVWNVATILEVVLSTLSTLLPNKVSFGKGRMRGVVRIATAFLISDKMSCCALFA